MKFLYKPFRQDDSSAHPPPPGPVAVLAVCSVLAATADQLPARQATPPYLNPNLPANQRAADLVSRMSLDEKVSQLVNDAPAKVSVVVRNIGERAGE